MFVFKCSKLKYELTYECISRNLSITFITCLSILGNLDISQFLKWLCNLIYFLKSASKNVKWDNYAYKFFSVYNLQILYLAGNMKSGLVEILPFLWYFLQFCWYQCFNTFNSILCRVFNVLLLDFKIFHYSLIYLELLLYCCVCSSHSWLIVLEEGN